MQPSKPQPFRLPQRFDSPTLAKYAIPGEPTVIVRAVGVGSTAPFEYSDRNGRQAIFRYEREYDAHVLKVPASVWNHNKGFMAHELMDQRRLPHPLVVTVEVPDTQQLARMAEALPKAASTISKSQDGQEAKSSGPYPESASASLAPATTSEVYQALIDMVRRDRPLMLPWLEAAVEVTVTDILVRVKDVDTDGKKITLTFQHADEMACDALQSQIHFLDELSGVIGKPLVWCFNVSPEMDAPGNSEEASDVVVGQVSEQPGASATFSPEGSGTDMPLKNEPAGDDALPFLAGSAWTLCEKPQRLKDLAGALNTDAETLKSAILHPLSAVELGHAGWVKRREPQA